MIEFMGDTCALRVQPLLGGTPCGMQKGGRLAKMEHKMLGVALLWANHSKVIQLCSDLLKVAVCCARKHQSANVKSLACNAAHLVARGCEDMRPSPYWMGR